MISAPGVLYVVICGVDNATTSYGFITDVMADGWDVCAVPTPDGSRFVDTRHLAALTGHPVRSEYRDPDTPDLLPPADAFVVAPASFNTVNKIATGISDTLAAGIICEAIGNQRPVIVAPWMNRALASHSGYARSIQNLQSDGVRVVLTDRTKPARLLNDPGGSFPGPTYYPRFAICCLRESIPEETTKTGAPKGARFLASRDVRIWAIKINKLGPKKRSYTVRWTVATQEKSKTFAGRALADNYRSELMQALNNGEAFNVDGKGLPESMEPAIESVTWLTFVKRYVTMKWPSAAAKSRSSINDALATVTPALVKEVPGRPDPTILRKALSEFGLAPESRQTEAPPELADALRWLDKASLRLTDLTKAETVRAGLDAVALTLDGTAAAATTSRRKRSVFYNVLQYAVELELLEFNPVDKLRVRTNRKKVAESVDRRSVANPRQARQLLTAVSYVGSRGKDGKRGERLVAFFACLYFAALRPGEALALREHGCYLPKTGWGLLTLERSRPSAGKRYTDSGDVHDDRGLKHRGDDEPRTVPIPPELVAILRAHIKRFKVGAGDYLFRSERGNPVSSTTYYRVWREARTLALTPRQVESPLAARPYDLRHAAVSLWLNAGVSAPDVAERAGHSVDVLLKVYAKCIDGDTEIMNTRIAAALAAQ